MLLLFFHQSVTSFEVSFKKHFNNSHFIRFCIYSKYLAVLCQCLYDCLRPSLININHFEILSELCCILKKEVLTEEICSDSK